MDHPVDGPSLANRITEHAIHDPALAPQVVLTAPPVVLISPSPAPVRPRFSSPTLVIGLVLLGLVLRTAALLSDRCLWIDESMLALNLIARSPAGLLKPLDWNQGAPVGFMLLVKATMALLGTGELALRLVPFLASAAGLIGFAWIARRLMPAPSAVLALTLFTISPYLISYAAECKQYAVDAAVTIGLFACAVGLLQGKSGGLRWAGLAAAGAAAVWLSHPAAFVLGGIGTGLLLGAMLTRERGRLLPVAGTIGCWLASFAVCYFVSLRHLGGNQYLLDYWAGHFLSLPPKSIGDLAWLADHFFGFFAYPGGLGGTEIRAGGIAAALFLVGVSGFWKQSRPMAVALVVPGLLALLASGLHKYPFAGRLLLFLVPLGVIGVARGAWMTVGTLQERLPVAAAVVLGILLAAPALETYQQLCRPMRYEQLGPVLEQIRDRWQPGDRMYLYYGATPAFLYYTRNEGFPAEAIAFGEEARQNRAEYRDQLALLQGQRRVWLVFSHRHHHEEDIIRAYAEAMGRCVDTIPGAGAAAYLFDFTTPQLAGVGRPLN